MNELKHIGMIMDGNRRWAKKNNMESVLKGHEQGVKKLMEACDWCLKRHIPYLTVYAFSTENWNRSEYEINGLFSIMEKFFDENINDCIDHGIHISVIGDRMRLKERQRNVICQAEEKTKNCKDLYVQICISYGGHNEVTRAVKKIIDAVQNGEVKKDEITENTVAEFLDTAGVPMVDMVIRTGGNHRLSNFLIWQAAYAEIYFTDVLWPDFTEAEFEGFLEEFRSISINLGK